MMEDIKQAIEAIQRINRMEFEDFYPLVEEYLNKKFDKSIIDEWKFIGLSNQAFFMMYAMDQNSLEK